MVTDFHPDHLGQLVRPVLHRVLYRVVERLAERKKAGARGWYSEAGGLRRPGSRWRASTRCSACAGEVRTAGCRRAGLGLAGSVVTAAARKRREETVGMIADAPAGGCCSWPVLGDCRRWIGGGGLGRDLKEVVVMVAVAG